MIAAEWLAAGLDSPSLRELAGEDGTYSYRVDELWALVVAELGVVPHAPEESWGIAMAYEVAACRAGDKAMVDVVREVVRFYIEADYPTWATGAGHLLGLADELDGRWGRSSEEVLSDAFQTLDDLKDPDKG